MSDSDEDWKMGKTATKKVRSDYSNTILLAQFLFNVIESYSEIWNLSSGLYEGFRVEVENIKRVGVPLAEGLINFDRQILIYMFYMERLRQCYDQYAVFTFTFEGGPKAIFWQPGGEEIKGCTQKKVVNDKFFGELKIKENALWSTPKLQQVLQQSQDCTSKLLNCTSPVLFTLPTLTIDREEVEEETYTGEPKGSDSDDDTTVSFNPKAKSTMILQHQLSEINPLAPYQTTTLTTAEEGIVKVFSERKCHECSTAPQACASVHKNLLRLADQLQKLPPHENSGLLHFRGLVKFKNEHGSYAFIYDLPHQRLDQQHEQSWICLRDLINNNACPSEQVAPPPPPPLARLKLARRICRTLSRLHAGGILHKGLEKRAVVFFHCTSASCDIVRDTPYVVNADFSRPIREQTSYGFARDLEQDMSRHPGCQGAPSCTRSVCCSSRSASGGLQSTYSRGKTATSRRRNPPPLCGCRTS
jgi:hypothetical protein